MEIRNGVHCTNPIFFFFFTFASWLLWNAHCTMTAEMFAKKKSRRLNFTLQHSFPKGEELGWAIVRAPQIRVTLAYLAACTDIKCRWSPTRALSFVYNTKEYARALPFTSFPLRQHQAARLAYSRFNCLLGFYILTHNLLSRLLVPVFFSAVSYIRCFFLLFTLVMVSYRTSAQWTQMFFYRTCMCSFFFFLHFCTRILISRDKNLHEAVSFWRLEAHKCSSKA